MKTVEYCDLGYHDYFAPHVLQGKALLHIPSQGEEGTKILTGEESEMYYEHRQEGEALACNSTGESIFVSREPLSPAEDAYRQHLFGEQRPKWIVAQNAGPGVPLDQVLLMENETMAAIQASLSGRHTLYGFNETPSMAQIAEQLGMAYYGNHDFAEWAGTKTGLHEFAEEHDLQSPHTLSLNSADPQDLLEIALHLQDLGYEELVIKVAHSTGGMGHKRSLISDVIKGCQTDNHEPYLPDEFLPEEGAAVQGWLDTGKSMSLAYLVDFDGSYYLTGAQQHLLEGESEHGAIGAVPIDQASLEAMMNIAHPLGEAYSKCDAFGPHTMGMLLPSPEEAQKLGFIPDLPLLIDENTRAGASTISRAWIFALREGRYGIGWIVSKIPVSSGVGIESVIETLDSNSLLIKQTGANAHGVFVFNGSVLPYEKKFYAVAISGQDDPAEAQALIQQAQSLFK